MKALELQNWFREEMIIVGMWKGSQHQLLFLLFIIIVGGVQISKKEGKPSSPHILNELVAQVDSAKTANSCRELYIGSGISQFHILPFYSNLH